MFAGRARVPFYLTFFLALTVGAAGLAVIGASSVAVAAPAAKCPDVAADETAAMGAAVSCHGRVEVLSGRGEKSVLFANANGSFTVEASALVQRVRAGGRWVKPDVTLRRDAYGRLAPAATSLHVSFSGGGSGPAVTIGKGAAELGLYWPTALPTPTLSMASATYADVLPGVDLTLTAQVEGFAEVLVVKNAAAAVNPALAGVRFRTHAKGLRMRQGAAGALTAVDDSGATLFGSGTPMMWDSAKPAGDGPSRAARLVAPGAKRSAMPVELAADELVVHPDLTMLRDKATKFPVYIDPALGRTAWTMINNNYPSQSYWSFDRQDCPDPYASIQCAKVGYTNQPTSMIYRSLFAFGISSLLHKHVQDAKLSMDTVYSWTNTDYPTQVRVVGGINSGTNWTNNSGSWGPVIATANSHAYDRQRRRTEWGVTGAVQTAAGGTNGTLTLGLRAADEGTVNQWKKFDAGTALLTVIYNSFPNAPDNITVDGQPCAQGASRPYVRNLMPALKARVSDPDGTVRLLKATFYWWNLSGGSRTAANSVAQGSIVSGQYATATIPSGRLTDGAIYVVQAIANDGIDNGQYSTTCEFQVDVTAPGPPSEVTSTTYPNNGQANGGVGTAGTFVLKPPPSVPSDFYGYAYTLDPGISAAAATQVTANSTDHTATISITPTADQTYNLRVWTRDKAGNYSAAYVYQFSVRAGTGPDARWTFDGQDGSDDSAHGNTLTLNGGTWTAGRGGYGKALLLNTSQSANTAGLIATKNPATGAPISLHSNQSFTVAATVRLDSTLGSGNRVIVAQDGSRTSPFLLSYSEGDKKWRFAVAQTDVDAPTTVAVHSNAPTTIGVWTRLVATYDGTTHALRLYVNGVQQTETATSTTFDATGPVTIGRMRWVGDTGGGFPGAIDDVRIYGRVVGSAEHEFAMLNYPNPPLVSFPSGTSAYAGKNVQAVISAGGDTSVTKVKYQLGASGTATTVTLAAAGGQATVNLTSTTVGESMLMASGIDAAGNVSPIASSILTFTEVPQVSGRVTDAISGAALSGVTVVLTPGDLTRTTDAAGGYSFTGVTAGTYTVTASRGGVGCAGEIASTEVDINGKVVRDLLLAPYADVFGYRCEENPGTAFITGTTRLDLAGDDEVSAPITLPFPAQYYGKSYDRAWVSTNGAVSFVDQSGWKDYPGDVSLPSKDVPLGALMPFWTNLQVDGSASVWTGLAGTGDAQRFVVEWRNVRRADRSDSSPRISFEVVLAPNGDVTFNYSGLSDDETKGSYTTVGITSPGGAYAVQYLHQTPELVSGTAVTFAYPDDPWPLPTSVLSGHVTSGGAAVAGAVVYLDNRRAWTDESGYYEFADLDGGAYQLTARRGCEGADRGGVDVENDMTVDIELAPYLDTVGNHCATTSMSWTPGDDPVSFPADGSIPTVPLPFAFPWYGKQAPKIGIINAGEIYFPADSAGATLGGGVEVWPGSYAMLDGQSQVLTRAVGAAPNRKFVVEWRNAFLKDYPSVRITFEVVVGEDGTLTVVPRDIPSSSATHDDLEIWYWGPFNSGGGLTYYESDGRALRAGNSVTFYPPAG